MHLHEQVEDETSIADVDMSNKRRGPTCTLTLLNFSCASLNLSYLLSMGQRTGDERNFLIKYDAPQLTVLGSGHARTRRWQTDISPPCLSRSAAKPLDLGTFAQIYPTCR